MLRVRSSIRTIIVVAAAMAAVLSALVATSRLAAANASGSANASVSRPAAAVTETLAITGGDTADVAEYSFMATVQIPGSFCGGTLIAKRWVLTAYHCVEPETGAPTDPNEIFVRLGVTDTALNTGVVYGAKAYEAHPTADIALIELDEPVRDFRPVALAKSDEAARWAARSKGVALGWGLVSDEGRVERTLRSAELAVVADSTCTGWNDDPTILCAGGDGVGVCRGDSGGPLLVTINGTTTEVGVTSYGMYCGSIAGFVEIAHYSDWISATIGTSDAIAAQVETSCVSGNSETRFELANTNPYAQTVTVTFEGEDDRVVSVPAHSTLTETFEGRSNGRYAASVIVDGTAIFESTEVVDCSFNVEFSYRCVAGDGAFDARITNADTKAVSFEFVVDTFTKSATIDPGRTELLTISGRPDGYHKVKLLRNGVEVEEQIIAIDCDPPQAEVVVNSSCLAGMGRVDVELDNPTEDTQTYSVTVGRLAERKSTVGAKERSRVTVTGRPDGEIPVFVQRSDGNLTIRTVEVDCTSPSDEPVMVKKSCLAGNGRIDVMLTNPRDTEVEYAVKVGSLAERVRRLQALMSDRVTVTGRPDGPISVVVTRDGAQVYSGDVEVNCDR